MSTAQEKLQNALLVVEETTSTLESVKVYLDGEQDRDQAIRDEMASLGVTNEQLVPLDEKLIAMDEMADMVADAIVANTPAADEPPIGEQPVE